MAECGAWLNFGELEESLSLDELLQLHETTMERQQRLMKTVAAALGADVSGGGDEERVPVPTGSYNPEEGGFLGDVEGENDVKALPINLGYSKI